MKRLACCITVLTRAFSTLSNWQAAYSKRLKYAYNGRDTGKLGLGLAETPDGIEITFWDDGSGIDKNARVDSGLGQKLVEAFVQQLGGVLTQTSDQHGTRHSLAIPNGELSRI